MAFDAQTSGSGLKLSLPRGRIIPVAVVAIALLCALLLVLPGQTQSTKYVNDLLIFLDGAYRISWGQVPNRDFHSALGPLSFYLPAAGYLLTGSMGSAMPVATALLLLVVTPVMVHVIGTRTQALIGIPLAAVLLLVIAVPMNLGELFTDLSFGMYYNRFGWSLLALLFVMHLRPIEPRPRQQLLDALCAAVLAGLLCYLKISYGMVAVGFLVLTLLDARQRGWAAAALAATAALALVVEAFWRSTGAYIGDILLAAEVSGAVRGTMLEMTTLAVRNLADYCLFVILALVALWQSRSLRDLLFYGYCAGSGYLLLNQNFQSWVIVTLYAGGAVAAQKLLRPDAPSTPQNSSWAAAAPLLLFALIAPTAIISTAALATHAALAIRGEGEDFALPNLENVRLANLVSPWDHEFSAGYINTLRNGAVALATLRPEAERVYVMDFVNPFSAGLQLEPPRGDLAWQHIDRTFDRQHFLPPAEILQDVDVVMEPKYPVERFTYYGLKDLYLPYIHANFELAAENENWWVWQRRTSMEAEPET